VENEQREYRSFEHQILVELAEIRKDIKSFCGDVAGMRMTMFGPDGRDGLVGDVADVKHSVADLLDKQAWWNRGLLSLQVLVAGIAGYFGTKT
jgi:hypothetical protein